MKCRWAEVHAAEEARRFLHLAAIACLAAVCASSEVSAQVVRGQVVEDATKAPIEGAFVLLLGQSGQREGAVLTDSLGAFLLQAPAGGTYTLRVERIGYEDTVSPPLELVVGRTLVRTVSVPVQAIELEGLVTSGKRRCRIPEGAGDKTHALWEEARKALSVTTWLQEQGLGYQARNYEQTLDITSLELLNERAWLTSGMAGTPFRSEPAGRLAELGYVRELKRDSYQYLGPDASTLLSDEFLATHCFQVKEGKGRQKGLAGLAFEPLVKHGVPDIAGVLWLDEANSELRYLEFTFTRHLYAVEIPLEPFGGRVEFRRLEHGGWIVSRWWLRMPQLSGAVGSGRLAGESRPTDGSMEARIRARRRGVQVKEEGAEVRFISEPGPARRGPVTVRGVVFDSARNAPLAGAMVFLKGARQWARTGRDGTFSFGHVPEGEDEIAFIDGRADALGSPVIPRPLDIRSDVDRDVRLSIPRRPVCADHLGDETAAVAGYVYDVASDTPLPKASVTVVFTDERGKRDSKTTRSDVNGRYAICGLATAEETDVAVTVSAGDVTSRAAGRVRHGGLLVRNLRLSVAGGA